MPSLNSFLAVKDGNLATRTVPNNQNAVLIMIPSERPVV
jgi:hypothetical protein